MAPEFAPKVVVFNSRFDNGVLKGVLEYIETPDPDKKLRIRWSVQEQPRDYNPVGGGVAYIYTKDAETMVVPISEDASPTPLGNDRYLWTEGLQFGNDWLMFILILPQRHTLIEPDPLPINTKIFEDRVALYWALRSDNQERTRVEWTMKELKGDIGSDIMRINKNYLSKVTPNSSTIEIEDASDRTTSEAASSEEGKKKTKWWIGAIIAPLIVGLVIAFFNVFLQKSTEVKYGELLIECNIDSAEIYLNKAFKGITVASDLQKLENLKPGNYILKLRKEGYQDYIDDNIKITAGEVTTKKISLEQTTAVSTLTEYVRITIQTPIRDVDWNAVDLARRGERFRFTGNIVKSPKGNKYYEIELGKNKISRAYIWDKESELIKEK